MPILILVRHSISRQQPGASSHRWGLTEEGQARCVALAAHLRQYRPAVIVTSGEPKAVQTGASVAGVLGLPVAVEHDLGEHRRAHAPYLASRAAFEAIIYQVLTRPEALIFGEETGAQACARFQAAIDRIVESYAGQTVVAVTHGTVITLFLAKVAGVEPIEFWQALGMPAYVVLNLPDFDVVEIVSAVT